VHSFDIQPEAIHSTRNLLEASGLIGHVTLHERSHAELTVALPESHRGKISVALFNLGYLPGSDQKIVTQPESTAIALESALAELKSGGRLICVATPDIPEEKRNRMSFINLRNQQKKQVILSKKLVTHPTNPSLGF
jgi:hypothetical protein